MIDLETGSIRPGQSYSYDEDVYLHMRLQSILKLWPLLQGLIVSPWSNIRSLSYGVICNWVRPDLHHYKSSHQKQFCQIVFSTLISLLQSKDSECRTGGLNILGSLCGLSYNFDRKVQFIKSNLKFFRRHENMVSLTIWESVYELQNDWDVTNQAAAMTIIQVCAPRDSISHFFRLKREGGSFKSSLEQELQGTGNLGAQAANQIGGDFDYENTYSSKLQNIFEDQSTALNLSEQQNRTKPNQKDFAGITPNKQ